VTDVSEHSANALKDAIWALFGAAEESCKSEGWIILDLLDLLDRGVTVATIRAELESWTAHQERARREVRAQALEMADRYGWTT
jgi:hypothetical protein